MLALSTLCAPAEIALDRVVASFRPLEVRAVALHRPATVDEARALAPLLRRVRLVAQFGAAPGASVGAPLLVLEGGPAADHRETSLEELCRRLHALRGVAVALRAPAEEGGHPAPHELALVAEALPFVGYWHDAERAGPEYLEVAGALLRGASFHPLADVDLTGIRDALSASAPAVVACPPGTARDEVREALRRARGYFRA